MASIRRQRPEEDEHEVKKAKVACVSDASKLREQHPVVLNPADCDLDFKIESDGLRGSALYEQGFAYCWSGARATIGITGGKYCFGCKIISLQPVEMNDTATDQQHLCRLGISRGDCPVGNLGETKQSFGFGGTGKFSSAGKFSDYGEKFGIGDTIVCAVNLESNPLASIGFSKNGKWLGTAIQFDAGPRGLGVVDSPLRKLQWESAFFPHVLLKNVEVQLQFSIEEGLVPEEGFKPWACALDDNNALLGPTFNNLRDCEVMMMVGLPASGKSTWAKKWADDHPEKRYILLGTNLILDQMKLPGLLRKHNYGERFDRLMDQATRIFNVLLSRAASIPRNYIIDQTNVYKNARKRKLKPFAYFQKIAVVVFPKPEELQHRSAERFREMGKEVPADAVNEMLANYILPTSKDMPGSEEYFDEVIFVELDRAESQRYLDGMKRALTSESRDNFTSFSQASTTPPQVLPSSRYQGLCGISDDRRYGSPRFISEVHQENMHSPLPRFVRPHRPYESLISETRFPGPSSHPPLHSYPRSDPYSIDGHFRDSRQMGELSPREYTDVAYRFLPTGELPPREYTDVAYPFPPTGSPYGTPPRRPTYQSPSNMPYGRGYASPRPSGGSLVAYADASPTNGVPSIASKADVDEKKKKVVVLGTGWAGTSFLKNIKDPSYEVQVISPRNYFAFTPLLPSVTCGTVEARSIVEPIRNIVRKKRVDIRFNEAECYKIDSENRKLYCRSNENNNLNGKKEFVVDYDYLVIAVGAQVNTFNTPGVVENCHFLKEVEDAQRIRRTVIDCFERASLPTLNEDDRKKILHFAVVGGGPTGVEFAAELHDFVNEDLVKLYPGLKDFVKITLLEAGDHILNMFDKRITAFAEEKFRRDGIDVKTGSMVIKVTDKEISTKEMKNGEISSMSYGMTVWSTGIGTRPIIRDFMTQIGQANRRALATDEWLRVEGCDNVYALGDCATINQRRVMEDISAIFSKADRDNSGTLTVKEFKEVIDDICERYPQVELYLKNKQMNDIVDLLKGSKGDVARESIELNIEEFKSALSQVDSQMKNLPATAQVAAQQGAYLAHCFNRMEECEENPEGPLRFRGSGRHRFRPFRYKHLGQFAPLGGEQTAAQLPGDWVSIGHSSQWLWYSVYASKQVSWRTRALVITDWTRRFVFGRDSSRI